MRHYKRILVPNIRTPTYIKQNVRVRIMKAHDERDQTIQLAPALLYLPTRLAYF